MAKLSGMPFSRANSMDNMPLIYGGIWRRRETMPCHVAKPACRDDSLTIIITAFLPGYQMFGSTTKSKDCFFTDAKSGCKLPLAHKLHWIFAVIATSFLTVECGESEVRYRTGHDRLLKLTGCPISPITESKR